MDRSRSGAGSVVPVNDHPAASPGTSYPGQRLGLPEEGPGSVAGWGRRLLALTVDWVAATFVTIGLIGAARWSGDPLSGWTTMLVFLVEAGILTALMGGSFGQLLCRVVVVRLDGVPVNLLQAFLRTFLICLVIPPLVFNQDGRGLHDLAVNTATLRR